MLASSRRPRKAATSKSTTNSPRHVRIPDGRDSTKTAKVTPNASKYDSVLILKASVALFVILAIYLTFHSDKTLLRNSNSARNSEEEAGSKSGRPFVETKLPGRGIGVIATRDIKQGELLIKEKPLFLVPLTTHLPPKLLIKQHLDGLSQDERKRFFNLSYVMNERTREARATTPIDEDAVALAIFETNAIAAGGEYSGIFPTTARLNHACGAAFNAVYSWRSDEGRLVVYALKSIRRGEEILTTYTDTKKRRDERRTYLLASYAFSCSCTTCSLPASLSSASDRRLERMTSLRNGLGASWGRGGSGRDDSGDMDGKTATRIVREIWALGEEEGYWSERGQLAADAAHVAAAHSDDRAVQAWASLALKWYTIELGGDSVHARDMERLVSHPRGHWAWASRRPEVVEGPGGLE